MVYHKLSNGLRYSSDIWRTNNNTLFCLPLIFESVRCLLHSEVNFVFNIVGAEFLKLCCSANHFFSDFASDSYLGLGIIIKSFCFLELYCFWFIKKKIIIYYTYKHFTFNKIFYFEELVWVFLCAYIILSISDK